MAFLLSLTASGLLLGTGAAAPRASLLRMQATGEGMVAATVAPAVKAERYVATNRFRVKPGREAAFEKRWADRKSRLGLLDGFRFFCMMRRVEGGGGDDTNYVSCTVWEDFASFDAWKRGDAFKEAHGGGTIGGVASMLMATAMNTKGKPKAAMWEGTLPVSMPPATGGGGGWREVVADGTTTLDGEAFIAMNRFSVLPGNEDAFEARFASRDSSLASFDGFQGFMLLRRDGRDDDGFTHSTWSVWKDKASFDAWKSSEKPKPKAPPAGAAAAGGPPGGAGSLFARPPVPTFYEGILVLESGKGV